MYTQMVKHFGEPAIDQPFWVELVGTSYCDYTYKISRTLEASNVYVAEYIIKGTGTLKVGGKEYHPSAGDFYMLQPGTPHEYYSSAHDPWVKIFANVYGPLCHSVVEDYGLINTVLVQNCDVQKNLQEIIDIACNSQLLESQIMIRCAGKFVELMANVSAAVHSEMMGTGNTEVNLLCDFLNANIHRNVSISELSRLIFRSSDYTIKLFKKVVGDTPYDYQLKRKMELCKRRLCTSNDSISDIASELGYTDPQHFSKLFKSKCGLSPRQYRNRYMSSKEGHDGYLKNDGLNIEQE